MLESILSYDTKSTLKSSFVGMKIPKLWHIYEKLLWAHLRNVTRLIDFRIWR